MNRATASSLEKANSIVVGRQALLTEQYWGAYFREVADPSSLSMHGSKALLNTSPNSRVYATSSVGSSRHPVTRRDKVRKPTIDRFGTAAKAHWAPYSFRMIPIYFCLVICAYRA